MALDACVYCNCYEAGKTKSPPPQPNLVYVDPDTGEVALRSEAEGADEPRFHEWLSSACEHRPLGQLVSHRLGNIARIGFLRRRFQESPDQFPTLLSKVAYSGTHCGDMLTLSDIEQVTTEMPALHTLHGSGDSDEALLREFERQMLELIQAARRVSKPIVF